jgi:hypothetical protein
VHDVVGAEVVRVAHVASGRASDGRHRVGVDDEVVAPAEQPVDEALGQPHGELAWELRGVVVVVEEGDVEVGRDDEPARPRSGLALLVLVEGGDEGPVRPHRGQSGHAVPTGGIRREVLHECADAAHDAADDGREGSATGHERQPG